MAKVVIIDTDPTHYNNIITAFKAGCDAIENEDFSIQPDWETAIPVIQADLNIKMVVMSQSGWNGYINYAQQIYPRVLTVMPMGSNTYEQLNLQVTNDPPIIVITGCSDRADMGGYPDANSTAYGKGMEFWSGNPLPEYEPYSSFSNGYIAGILYSQLILHPTFTWWEIRYKLRLLATRNEPTRLTNMWDLRNGYGNPGGAIGDFIVQVPEDPYLTTIPTTIGSIQAVNNSGSVVLTWDAVVGMASYRVYRNGTLIYNGSGLTFTDTIANDTTNTYKYKAYTSLGESTDFSASITVIADNTLNTISIKEIADLFDLRYMTECKNRGIKYFKHDAKHLAVLISMGQDKINRTLKCIRKNYNITLVSGQREYTLPKDYDGAIKVEYDGYTLMPISHYDMQQINNQGDIRDSFCVYYNGSEYKLMLNGTPTGTGTVNMTYHVATGIYSPSKNNTQSWGTFDGSTFTGNILLPPKFLELLLNYMLSTVFFDPYKALFEQELNRSKGAGSSTTIREDIPYNFGGL